MPIQKPNGIYGFHEPGGEFLFDPDDKGWIVFTDLVGGEGSDYTKWADQGIGVIVRLNHGYGDGSWGTIPPPNEYGLFAKAVADYVRTSRGAHIWIIGNEPNHPAEWPQGKMIKPADYAKVYALCHQQIHALPGHEDDEVLIAGIAPWPDKAKYYGNSRGDWVKYLWDVIWAIFEYGIEPDGFALHTYTHGQDPRLIASMQHMGVPFEDRQFEFRAYRDFMAVIKLAGVAYKPVYITECNPGADPDHKEWRDENTGWIQAAYAEINAWNLAHPDQRISLLAMYRWPQFDDWHINGKTHVYEDFRAAVSHKYVIQSQEEQDDEKEQGNMPINLLKNPKFLPPYTAKGADNIIVADQWQPFFANGTPPPQEHSQGPCAQPEFKPIEAKQYPYRVHSGETSQGWFAFSKVMDGGVFQAVDGFAPGELLEFSVYAHAWCSNSDDPRLSNGELYLTLGVDPTGGLNPWAVNVHWIQWVPMEADWKLISVRDVAQADRVTVWIRAWNKWRLKHNDIYVDDASLIVVGGQDPPPDDDDPPPEPPPDDGGDGVTLEQVQQAIRVELTKEREALRLVVREELKEREPVKWPR